MDAQCALESRRLPRHVTQAPVCEQATRDPKASSTKQLSTCKCFPQARAPCSQGCCTQAPASVSLARVPGKRARGQRARSSHGLQHRKHLARSGNTRELKARVVQHTQRAWPATPQASGTPRQHPRAQSSRGATHAASLELAWPATPQASGTQRQHPRAQSSQGATHAIPNTSDWNREKRGRPEQFPNPKRDGPASRPPGRVPSPGAVVNITPLESAGNAGNPRATDGIGWNRLDWDPSEQSHKLARNCRINSSLSKGPRSPGAVSPRTTSKKYPPPHGSAGIRNESLTKLLGTAIEPELVRPRPRPKTKGILFSTLSQTMDAKPSSQNREQKTWHPPEALSNGTRPAGTAFKTHGIARNRYQKPEYRPEPSHKKSNRLGPLSKKQWDRPEPRSKAMASPGSVVKTHGIARNRCQTSRDRLAPHGMSALRFRAAPATFIGATHIRDGVNVSLLSWRVDGEPMVMLARILDFRPIGDGVM